MESIYLRTLVEVARTGSITRAAEALAVTQSAASRRIRLLEEQYGAPLLDRSGPAIALTRAGAVVAEKGRKILEVERELAAELQELRARPPGLSFVCTPTFGIVHLPEIVRAFVVEHAHVGDLRVALEPAERIVAGLAAGEWDVGVIEHCQCFDLPEAERVGLVGDEMVFAAAPALRVEEPEVEIDRVLAHTLYTRPEGCCTALLQRNLAKLGRRMSDFARVVVYDDLQVICRAVIAGEGVAFVSSDLLAPHVRAGRLRAHRVSGFQHRRDRTLVRSRAPLADHAAAFVRRVVARVGAGTSAIGCA